MAFKADKVFDLQRIQKELNIRQKSIDNCPIEIAKLEEIYYCYQSRIPSLERIRTNILSVLNDDLKGKVHSIRCRIKDPDHLIEKIIRNANKNPGKYYCIDAGNYYKIITDLIGIRIIILDKRDWREVHHSLLQIFSNIPERYVVHPADILKNYDRYYDEATTCQKELENSYHAERPVVYITSEEDRRIYVDESLKIDTSKSHYRSIHYIIRYGITYVEIQMRTLFEEGWLEFDHRIKYPFDQNNKRKQEYAGVLSSLAIAADRLISFYEQLDFEQNNAGSEPENLPGAQSAAEEETEVNLKDKMKRLF